MNFPFSPLRLLGLIVLISFLLAIIQLGILTIAFEKLGLAPSGGLLLMVLGLFGSLINIPLFKIHAERPPEDLTIVTPRGLLRLPPRPFTGTTVVAVNVGGCLIPLAFSAHLFSLGNLGWWQVVAATLMVAAVSYASSRPIPHLGIGMPILVGPLSAALAALLMAPHTSAPLAYIAGTLGVLIGADVLRLKDIGHLGAPIASIGGAGTFDGIFITGIVAAFLA